MDYKQLLTQGDSDIPSSSVLWFHLANAAVLVVYLFIGLKVAYLISTSAANAAALVDSVAWLTLIISGIITGNKFANNLANLKLGNKNAATTNVSEK
jgi:hypothetical protein